RDRLARLMKTIAQNLADLVLGVLAGRPTALGERTVQAQGASGVTGGARGAGLRDERRLLAGYGRGSHRPSRNRRGRGGRCVRSLGRADQRQRLVGGAQET